MYCAATQWTPNWRRSQQKVRVSVIFRGCLEGFLGAETSVFDSSSSGFSWLYQTIFVEDWCIQRWVRGSVVPETGGWTISPIAYGSRALKPHKKNYHLTKLEFLVLKWAVTEHFKEYLPYQPFLVKTDNNPLTYVMTTPNLNTTSQWWVRALAWLNFKLEYQNGCDNTVVDMLSWVTTQLGPDTVRSILDGVALGAAHWAGVHDPTIVKGDLSLEWEVHVTTGCALIQMHVTDWAKAQREDPMLSEVLDWLKAQKKTDLNALLAEHASSEEGRLILRNWQNFTIHQGALYLHSMPKGETENIPLFMVTMAHWVAAIGMQVIRVMIIPYNCYRSTSVAGND